jgi:HAE1 family hydrophobic/amphiphilic exporter-1/multidrug efflux pump
MSTPEGSSYEYTDRFMQEISQLVDDSIPGKKVALVITSPGFGSSSVNSSFEFLWYNPMKKRISKEIAEKLTKWTKQYPDAKTSVIEQPTIAVNRRGGLPIQYIIQALTLKLEEKFQFFMDEVSKMKHLPLVT